MTRSAGSLTVDDVPRLLVALGLLGFVESVVVLHGVYLPSFTVSLV